MSYILEALKKSEQQRQQGSTPTLSSAAIAQPANSHARALHYGLPAAVLLCTGIAIGWWQPWHATKLATATEPLASPVSVTPIAESPHISPEIKKTAEVPPVPKPAPALQIAPGKPQSDVQPPARTIAAAPIVTPQNKQAEVAPVSQTELPASIQQEIPPIAVQFHAYSDKPKNRLVGINSLILHEGQAITPELRLEQITPDGVILSYKGYRILHGIRQ